MASTDPLFCWNAQLDDYDTTPIEYSYWIAPHQAKNVLKCVDAYANSRSFYNIPKSPSPLSHELTIEVEKPVEQSHPCCGKDCNVIMNSSLYFCPECSRKKESATI